MNNITETFSKVYVLDTNILLSDAELIHVLTDNAKNLIVLPETVLDELDSKKSGFDEINFQARKFARILSDDSEVLENEQVNDIGLVWIKLKTGEFVVIASKEKYDIDTKNTASNIINDRKILEMSIDISKHFESEHLPVTVLSNDIMMRTRAISKQLKTDFITENKNSVNFNDFIFERDIEFDIKDGMCLSKIEEQLGEEIPSSSWSFHFTNIITGHPYYGIRDNNSVKLIEEKVLQLQIANPKNTEQKFLSSLILSEHNDVICLNGKAGTGKNYITFSSAMRLMDTRRDLYSSIIYVRKTVLSDDKQGEVGFLPGTLEEKMSGYLAPLYNTLENFIKSKHKEKKAKELSTEMIQEEVGELVSKYDIKSLYLGHMRGSTISNAIVIIDEAQNMTTLDLQTALSRMGKDVKVIVMGSTKQIDNPYLNQYNNGLTYLASVVGDSRNYDMGVRLVGCELKKSVRSDIAEWTDEVF